MAISDLSVNKDNLVCRQQKPYDIKKALSLHARPEFFAKYTCSRCNVTSFFDVWDSLCTWCRNYLSIAYDVRDRYEDPKITFQNVRKGIK